MLQPIPNDWEELVKNETAINNDPVNGGIVDYAPAIGKWFVVFNDENLNTVEGIDSRSEAFRIHKEMIKTI